MSLTCDFSELLNLVDEFKDISDTFLGIFRYYIDILSIFLSSPKCK